MNTRNKPNYGIEPKYILMLGVFLCACLILLSYKFPALFNPLKRGINACLVPMQKGIHVIGSEIDDMKAKFDDIDQLRLEKNILEREVADLRQQNERLQQDLYEMERYKQLLELDEMYPEYTKVGANIIAKDSSGFYATFTIDKGTNDGLAVDMNVLADNGLVGIIIETGRNYSIVKSIIDDTSYVSAVISKTGDNCIVYGSLALLSKGFIRVKDISANTQAKNNYKVYTSELSKKYLPGLLIGYLSNITPEADGLTKEAYLTPVVDFEHLNTVLVIKELKRDLTTEE
ncbi:MAG: rod shape-determining protein MreC [Lachnospiraceae bacterium]|nr:rod shape-determining protein MreC [Lachnospiraceae bacterium]